MRHARPLALAALALLLPLALLAPTPTTADEDKNNDRAFISRTLDNLHDAAAKADFDRYFSCFDESATFFGTDVNEHWSIPLFKAYARPRFESGQGWTYKPIARNIFVSKDRLVAWFDEHLRNEKYGVCRGTGVLVNNGYGWFITQYHLTVPIPNDLLPKVVEMIREDEAARLEKRRITPPPDFQERPPAPGAE